MGAGNKTGVVQQGPNCHILLEHPKERATNGNTDRARQCSGPRHQTLAGDISTHTALLQSGEIGETRKALIAGAREAGHRQVPGNASIATSTVM